jgi:hypothetical protein
MRDNNTMTDDAAALAEQERALGMPEGLLLVLARLANPDIKTLVTTGDDSSNFHEVAVWNLRKALVEAYRIGRLSAG